MTECTTPSTTFDRHVVTQLAPSWKRPASMQSWPDTDSPAATLRIAKGLQNNCCLICKHRLPTLYNQSECAKQLVCNSSLCNQRLESTGWQLRIFFIKHVRRWQQICKSQVLHYHKQIACNCNLTTFDHKLIADWLCHLSLLWCTKVALKMAAVCMWLWPLSLSLKQQECEFIACSTVAIILVLMWSPTTNCSATLP